jgi:hypothetical protein
MSEWRMKVPCESCPFNTSGPGLQQRKALRPARWRGILQSLRQGAWFACHKTTGVLEDDDDGLPPPAGSLYCAGALAYEDKHGTSSNYRRVCESLEWFSAERKRAQHS